MATYKTPDVYVEEISIFPPSVAEVETAIPAFIGYTEKATRKGKSLINKPVRIKSILQYAEYFGGAPDPDTIKVRLSSDNAVEEVEIIPQYFLYDAIQLFFANGGGDCYIVSVGTYGETIELGDLADPSGTPGLQTGLAAVEKVDEPTILLFPDAVLLGDAGKLGDLQKAALSQCNKLKDRFTVFDVYDGDQERTYSNDDVITQFRNGIGVKNLKYGAAYYPWLQTNLSHKVDYQNVSLVKGEGGAETPVDLASISSDPSYVNALENIYTDIDTVENYIEDPSSVGGDDSLTEGYANLAIFDNKTEMENRASYIDDILLEFLGLSFTNTEVQSTFDQLTTVTSSNPDPLFRQYANTLKAYDLGYPSAALNEVTDGSYPTEYDMGSVAADDVYTPDDPADDSAPVRAANGRAKLQELFDKIVASVEGFLEDVKELQQNALETVEETNSIYQSVLDEISKEALALPPSGAIAGVYSYVDNNRGVWKSPANITLTNVVGPSVNITAEDQEDLNVDVNAGKSVNAIRFFTGKGTMVWGARTLAGNSNEWRYISVRRFFNMVEESVKKSTYWAVFEPNDANTWIRVKSMIENYLIQKWRDGALAGAKPDQAYFVKVGLGVTMTAQDILEGRMKVEIGMAVVRPAEFIILKFSHKMQES